MSDIPWENGFDPVAFAEKWIDEHPECLRPYLEALRREEERAAKRLREQ